MTQHHVTPFLGNKKKFLNIFKQKIEIKEEGEDGIRTRDQLETKISARSHDFMALAPNYSYNNGVMP